MRILVTGGSGFVGRAVVGQLRASGHDVRILSRRRPAPECGADWSAGSILEPDSLSQAFIGVDAVVHLVGIISEIGGQTYERVHVEGTVNVLDGARSAGVSRVVHMSALGTRPDARSRYHRSKWEAEQRVRESGLEWTIFRPSLIYGPGDGFVTLFARMARVSPVLPVIGPGTNQLQPVAVEDVARCFAASVPVRECHSRTFDVCGRERFTMDEVLTLILEATGRSRGRIHLPWAVAGLQARALEALVPAMLGKAPPLNRDQILMLQEDNIGDPEPACQMFGFEPVRFREGIRRFLAMVAD